MSLENVLVIMVSAIILVLIGMLVEKFFQGKRFTIVRFCKEVIIVMIGGFVGFVLDNKYNWPIWIIITVTIVVGILLAAVAAILDIVRKGKDNDESD